MRGGYSEIPHYAKPQPTQSTGMKRNLSVAAVSCMIMVVVMQWQGSTLKTPTSPYGIVDLEFANSSTLLQTTLTGWDLSVAKMNIWLDFVFIVTYVLFLSLAAEITAMKWAPKSWLAQTGIFLAKAVWVAGVLDIAENLLMLKTLAGNYDEMSLRLTFFCAAAKFVLVGLVIVYLLVCLPNSLRKR